MTVYIEYVLIENFIIDYLMLKASFALTARSVSRGRLLFCAFLGAMFALLFPLISVHSIILTIIKICFGLLIVLLAGKFTTKKSFYVTAIVFFCYTFLTGGAIIGVFSLFNIDYSTEYSVAFMVVPVYFIFKGLTSVVNFLYRQKDVNCFVRDIEITALGVTKSGKGFYDTGNELYDGDNPVIICGKKFAKSFLDGKIKNLKLKKISVGTVNGVKQHLAFEIEQIKIYNAEVPNIFKKVTLCISPNNVGSGYDVILHPSLKETQNEQAYIETQKIS